MVNKAVKKNSRFGLYHVAVVLSIEKLENVPKKKAGGGGTPYNGLYGDPPPDRGTFFTLQVYERVGIARVKVYERVGKSVI